MTDEAASFDDAFEELESRLMDTFNCWKSPKRCSLRGCVFAYDGGNYSHSLNIQPELTRVKQYSNWLLLTQDQGDKILICCCYVNKRNKNARQLAASSIFKQQQVACKVASCHIPFPGKLPRPVASRQQPYNLASCQTG